MSALNEKITAEREHDVNLTLDEWDFILKILEKDFSMSPKEMVKFDGVIFLFACDKKDTYDAMWKYYSDIRKLNVPLICRIVVCNKIDLFEEFVKVKQSIAGTSSMRYSINSSMKRKRPPQEEILKASMLSASSIDETDFDFFESKGCKFLL